MVSTVPSWSPKPYPDFYIIGAAKCGTTTLAEYLARHPGVCFSRSKEPEVLRNDSSPEKIRRSYERLFSEEKPGQIRGEGSTAYSGWANWPSDPTESRVVPPMDSAAAPETMMREIDETARRMAGITPNARIIYLLRHPVDRVYSQIRFNTRNAPVPVDIDETLKIDPRYIQVSQYAAILKTYLRHFAREQFFVARLDEMAGDLPGFLNRVQDFLGLSRDASILQLEVFTNEAKEHEARRALAGRFQKVPAFGLLRQLAPAGFRKKVFGMLRNTSLAKGPVRPAPMSAATRVRLLEQFARSNQELGELTGLNLSDWSK